MGLDTDRGWSRIRRVPGSIPGTAGSYLLSYFWEICEEFWVCLGHISGHFLDIFGDVWDIFSDTFWIFSDMSGTYFRTFLDMSGTCFRIFSDMSGTYFRSIFGPFPDFNSDFLIFLTVPKRVLFS